jgi:hypothetical protein
MIDKWKIFKQDAYEIQYYLQYIVDYAEKIRNLFFWENPRRTGFFCLGIVILMYILVAIPPRIILTIALFASFVDGKVYTKKRIDHNKEVCKFVLESLYKQFLSNFFLKIDSSAPWPNDLLESPSMQKKMVEIIRIRTALQIENDLF